MRARLRLGTGEQEEQPHRFTIHRFIRHGSARRAGNRNEIGEGWSLAMWNRYAVADSSRELPLPLHHGLQNIRGCPVAPHQEVDQLP